MPRLDLGCGRRQLFTSFSWTPSIQVAVCVIYGVCVCIFSCAVLSRCFVTTYSYLHACTECTYCRTASPPGAGGIGCWPPTAPACQGAPPYGYGNIGYSMGGIPAGQAAGANCAPVPATEPFPFADSWVPLPVGAGRELGCAELPTATGTPTKGMAHGGGQ